MSAVYFVRIGDDGPVKIGFTREGPAKRIAQLQQSCPWKLRMMGFVAGSKHHERALQERLQKHRMEGEWFAPHREVITLINNVLLHGLDWCGVELSPLDQAIAKAGSNYDLERAIGVNSTTISLARTRGMGPKLEERVKAYLGAVA